MKTTDRKAALAAYKKRKVAAGIYALHFDGTDQKWVGYTPDLSKLQNRFRFTLGLGSHPSRDLQAAWNNRGASDLIFEELEQFDADEAPAGAALQARLAQWRGELNALPA
ncbi:GIY-YIG nuclease family protein [Mesorhizobium sp. INR15]|uniref:GIY-YIG nuclease family protein n=1 Tax=Mesorhizobium sp. INR15 TaxID=2654248 RepID=UPI00189669E0|nr:GIY-YIG nuclease family protein [Mesorhizobium sp. INR15]QPC90260.1 GIY-YIG nuclease family protein [Mesorhizobium sp. INR15]